MAKQELGLARRVISPPQQETPGGPQAQRRDPRRRAQFGLIIAVPAHMVSAAAIAVQQHAVEATDARGLQALTQGLQHRWPGVRHELGTGVTVAGLWVADPAAQPR
ncbi:hypothetical protein G6F55_014347 [Rhizopus delemar]|nr:hypothetical protein G6F55_014347 [Rhizopus delemar]